MVNFTIILFAYKLELIYQRALFHSKYSVILSYLERGISWLWQMIFLYFLTSPFWKLFLEQEYGSTHCHRSLTFQNSLPNLLLWIIFFTILFKDFWIRNRVDECFHLAMPFTKQVLLPIPTQIKFSTGRKINSLFLSRITPNLSKHSMNIIDW